MAKFIHQFGNTNSEVAEYKSTTGRTVLSEPREFLDAYLHAYAKELRTIEAPTWIDARNQIFI
jgi:hypothetical protein